jgi:nucleotide-binding universal stress UspA family protein
MGVLAMKTTATYERILIATDGSDCSAHAIDEGMRLAKASASLVTLMYVVDDSAEVGAANPTIEEHLRREANTALHQGHVIASRHGVMVTDRIARGQPVVEIVREAESFDLVVMGSHGKGLFERMVLGSVTEGVLSHLQRPLLIVPPWDRRDDQPTWAESER